MLYKKPNIKYVDMCKYIDDTIYTDQCDEDLTFQYLYHLANMLAHKGNFFNRTEYYEDFAVYMATSVFMRLKNPKQFELKPDGTPKLKQIKSVLNYLKKTIYPRKVDFEQKFYSQAITSLDEGDYEYDLEYSLADKMSESIDDLSMVEFNMCLGDVAKTAKAFLQKIPYKSDPAVWNNIYISCMLTFLNSVTLKNKDIRRLQNLKAGLDNRPHLVEDLYKQESKDSVILFHLEDSMKDYIQILTCEMKHAIAKDLSLTLHTYVPSTAGMKALILSEVNSENCYKD